MASKVSEMAEQKPKSIIKFSYEGSDFLLEYDRESAERAESLFGISPTEVFTGKVTVMKALFAGAFIKHHPKAKTTTIDALWDLMPDKDELYKTLVGMYMNTVGTLLEDPEEGKALSWEAM